MCCCSNKSENVKGNLKDPVCGMTVSPTETNTSEYGGVTYSFCCGGWKRTFDSFPHQYATASKLALMRS